MFGAANYLLFRGNEYSARVAALAVQTVADLDVDHVVVTGDVSNLALDREFEAAAALLEPLWDPVRLTVVPGNHDYYTPGAVAAARFEHWFGELLWPGTGKGSYPAVKDLGDAVLVAARSASRTAPMCAHGRLDNRQLERTALAVSKAHASGKAAVVAFHHNLHRRTVLGEVTGRLLDKRRITEFLAGTGAELVLHGHDHHEHEMVITSPGGGRGTLVAGCGSTSRDGLGKRAGRLNVYEVTREGVRRVERWRYERRTGRFVNTSA